MNLIPLVRKYILNELKKNGIKPIAFYPSIIESDNSFVSNFQVSFATKAEAEKFNELIEGALNHK